jgi:hypothetical protein
MARIAVILAVAVFCVLNARTPDPRMRATVEALTATHTHQFDGNIDGSFYCPMDPDVRALRAGKCTRCGMTLVEGVPDIVEYPLDLKIEPPLPRPTDVTRLTFGLADPRTLQPVRRFEVVHEQLYHVFLVSQDLSFFLHTHPERQPDEDFHLDVRLPKPGMYPGAERLLPVRRHAAAHHEHGHRSWLGPAPEQRQRSSGRGAQAGP